MVVGARVHITARSSPRSIVPPNAIQGGALDPDLGNAVTSSVLGDALGLSSLIVW